MFSLADDELRAAGPILDCPAGASSFGAEVRALGGAVVSADPAYARGVGQVLAGVRDNLRNAPEILARPSLAIDWSFLGSPEAYVRACSAAADRFRADWHSGGGHYVAASLPRLPFGDGSFGLALSSHLLFIYHQHLSFGDHLAGLLELARVTRGEVRVHPIMDAAGTAYPRLDELRAALAKHGVATEIRRTAGSWIAGGDRALVCHRS